MEWGFWKDNPEKLEFLQKWYPHWGRYAIAQELNLPRAAIRNAATRYNLRLLPKKERLCYYCRTGFQVSRTAGLRCAKCHSSHRAQQRRAYIHADPMDSRFKEILRTIKYRNRQMGFTSTDITLEYLKERFKEQGGLCIYSGLPMRVNAQVGRGRDLDGISIDQILPSRGYFKNNIVLCCLWANIAKNELSWREFVRRCHAVVEYEKKMGAFWALGLPTFLHEAVNALPDPNSVRFETP